MDAAADPKIERPGRGSFSLVWLIPVVAILVGLALLWRDYDKRGPVIEIAFVSADGVKAGQTAVRYRSVDVGRVEDVRFSADLKSVIAAVRLTPEIAPFVDEDAEFWVVRPQVSAQGVSGLDTVLSGSYIEGVWDTEPGVQQFSFVARTDPPLTPPDTPGKRIRLRAADGGSLSVGAPILFRGVEVGKVEARNLTVDGAAVEFDVFIDAPHDRRLTTDTRFWNVSGVDLSFGAEGARLRIASLASLVQGGASFEDLSSGSASPVEPGHRYVLYPSERDARARALEVDAGERLLLDVYFEGSVRGLNVGAPVEYQGIPVGQVASVQAEVDPEEGLFSTRTTIAITPSRLGLDEGDIDGSLEFLDKAVARGVRAQLASGNLLTGSLLVRLTSVGAAPGASPGEILRRDGRNPRFPATQSDLDELAGSVEGVLRRVDQLPIEELLANAVLLLENVNAIVGSEAAREAPETALSALRSLDEMLASDDLRRAPGEAAALLKSLRETVESEELAAARVDLAALLASARAVAAQLEENGAASEGAAALTALRARLEDPALAALAASMTSSLDAATALLAAPGLQETPALINETLASLRAVLDAPGLKEAPAELAGALASARSLLGELETQDAAGEIAAAARAARKLVDDPALRRLAEEAANAASSLNAVLGSENAGDLPVAASEALASAAALFDQLREENLAGAAADTLASIGRASDGLNAALGRAPDLIARLSAVAARADGMLASLDVGSELNYEMITAIREIRDAARAITDLADFVERQPNALILGR